MFTKHSVNIFRQLKRGQKTSFDLLQLSHRLEKGMTISDPKPLWGWDKARRIASLLKENNDSFSNKTASAVLSAYLDSKSQSKNEEDVRMAAKFLEASGYMPIDYKELGGTREVINEKFSEDELAVVEKLFTTRHSAREFSKEHVSKELIYKAVTMAQRCPSACNRQPYNCYVIDAEERRKKLPSFADYDADKYLIITGDIRAFVGTEINDWIVSPMIFASYLTLSLHALGIGSCVLKKQLVSETEYNRLFRNMAGLDESEIIIIEIAIGFYKDHYIAPISLRKQADEIVHYI